MKDGGADRDRTCDTHNAIVVLYQLSYDPIQSDGKDKVFPAFVKTFCRTFWDANGRGLNDWRGGPGRVTPHRLRANIEAKYGNEYK